MPGGVRRKITLGPGGPEKNAELVEIQQSSEQWNQYLLADGSVVRLKAVVVEVWRVLDEYDQDGNPSYVVRSRNVINVMAPDELRKPGP
jgi:hypothetical protein